MDIEIVKQLKATGLFPRLEIHEYPRKDGQGTTYGTLNEPNLGELIKVCGTKFKYLFFKQECEINELPFQAGNDDNEEMGQSPQEAVAKLLLKSEIKKEE